MVSRATLMLAIVLAAATARAEPTWATVITTDQLKGHVSAEDTVMVVRAGQVDEETTAAATALINAVKAAGAKVLDDSALGDVSQLANKDIVPKAVAAGATAVGIVRVPNVPDQDRVAEVAIFGKDGALRTTFAGMKGKASHEQVQAIPPQPQTQPRLPPPPGPPPAAKAQYQAQHVGFGEYSLMTWNGPQTIYGPYQGRDHRALTMPEFFDIVGRHDLADSYRSKEGTRSLLVTGGGLVMLGSLVTAAILVSSAPQPTDCDPFSPAFDACEADVDHSRSVHFTSGVLVGLIGTAAGAGLAIGGYSIEPMPVSSAEAKNLADQYNARLKHQLGGARETPEPPVRLSLRPELGPHGGRLALDLRF